MIDERRFRFVPRPHAAAVSGAFASLAANAVAGLVIARELGPAGRGEVSYAFLLMSVGSTIAYFGIDYAATHLLAPAQTRTTGSLRLLLRAAVLSGLTTAAAVVAVAAVLRPPAAAAAVFVGVVAYTVSRIGGNSAYAVGQAGRASAARAAVGAVYLAATVAVLALDQGADTVVWVWAVAGMALAAAFVGAARLGGIAQGPADAEQFKRFLKLGRATWQSSLAQLVTYRLDQVVVLGVLGAADLGRYSAAVFVMSLLWVVADSVGDIEHPAGAGLAPDARYARARQVAARLTALVAAAAVAIVTLSPAAVPFVLGDGYGGVPVLLALLAPGTVAMTAGKVAGAALMAGGHTAAIRSATFLTAGMAAVGTYPAVSWGGARGAAAFASLLYTLLSWRLWRALVRSASIDPA